MDYRRTLPFYMIGGRREIPFYEPMSNGRPNYPNDERDYFDRYRYPYFADRNMDMSEDEAMRDLEYWQQMYPADVKKYQKKISDLLDKIDYQDSLIYDEYPDKLALGQLQKQIIASLKKEMTDAISDEISEEKWDFLEDLILVILFYEIYKRRRRMKRRY